MLPLVEFPQLQGQLSQKKTQAVNTSFTQRALA